MKKLFGLFIGLMCITCIGLVSANELQVDVDQPLIIKTSCPAVDATADIMIYKGIAQAPEDMWLSRIPMTQVSPTDFIDTETFTETGIYTAYEECTYDGGFISTQTTTITVTEYTNLVSVSTLKDYKYYADLYYDVYFKADPSKDKTVRFNLGIDTLTFQPKELNIINLADTKVQRIRTPDAHAKAVSENNIVTYPNVYGNGLSLAYNINTRYVKEDLIINAATDLPTANKDTEHGYLELNSMLTTTTKHFIVDGVEWNMQTTPTITTSNRILINDANGNTIYVLQVPTAFDSNGEKIAGTYTLQKDADKVRVAVKMPYDWFKDPARAYPVYVDPTIDTPDGTATFQSSTPRIVISDLTIPTGQEYTIHEQIMLDTTTIYDAECEADIIDQATGIKVVEYRSFYNDGQGDMSFVWGPSNYVTMPEPGIYTLTQYCWRGVTLNLNKIYANSTITVEVI